MTIGLLMAEKKLANLVYVEKKSQRIEDLIIKYDYKFWLSSNLSPIVMISLISVYYQLNFPSPPFVQISGRNYQSIDKKIDHLTKMIKDLALSV